MYCPECGSTIDDNAVFCGECGTKIGAGAQPPAPPVPPVPAPEPIPAPAPTPAPPAPSGAPKKKFPIWLIIVLAVVGVLVIGIVSVFALKSFVGKKEETLEETTSAYGAVEDAMDDFFTEETGTLPTVADITTETTTQEVRTKSSTTQKIVATRPPVPKTEVTKAPETAPPPSYEDGYNAGYSEGYSDGYDSGSNENEDEYQYDENYYPPAKGYTLDELEDAMDDFLYTGSWSNLSEYILPGSSDILGLMYEIEDEEGYANYAYQGGNEYINEYYFGFDYIPSIYSTDYAYHSLDPEDKDYRDNTDWGFYEMTEYAFDEYYGGNMEYYDLILMETFAYDSVYEDYGFVVFIIETDYGYFFLCE